jgi:hypothetical protein
MARGMRGWQFAVALAFLTAMTVLVVFQVDIHLVVFFGVMALWWQQVAYHE